MFYGHIHSLASNFNFFLYQFRVAVRKLRFEETGPEAGLQQKLYSLDKFLDQNLGSKYSVLNFLKRSKKATNVSSPPGQPLRTYFCSELVAAAYQVMELLPEDFVAAGTLPGNFAGFVDAFQPNFFF